MSKYEIVRQPAAAWAFQKFEYVIYKDNVQIDVGGIYRWWTFEDAKNALNMLRSTASRDVVHSEEF